ncbi:MAG TPA: ABC transporter permease [Chthoniobacter sp.]|jgi:ABC-type lipoprotein release transport system permease subunit
MNARTLVLSGARYYWRTHLGVLIGAALGALVLTGALLVGDSVKATLHRQAMARVGKADVAFTSGDRFFRAELAKAVANSAPVVFVRGSVSRADGAARVNTVQLLGVDDQFWKLSLASQPVEIPYDGVALNQRLAEQLGAKAGDTLVLRVEKPGMFSRDAPLSGEENEVVAIRAKVASVVSAADYGNFSLTASQIPPYAAFVPLSLLQRKIGLAGQANLLLAGHAGENGTPLTPAEVRQAVAGKFSLADASLQLRGLKTGETELRTPRVFLDPAIVNAAPAAKGRVEALTYFVNELDAGQSVTPYSMVTAVDAPASGFLPADLKDDEIVISQWLADDLSVSEGGKITIKYNVLGERRKLIEKSHQFTVRKVLAMDNPQLNTSWMPEFPGLSDKKNCRDWKPGFDFDSTKMRDKDQAYWEQYRGTPKAFVNLKIGQEMWSNRWGNLTSIRWPAGTNQTQIESGLLTKLTPESLGFQFLPLRKDALAATDAPVDFGQLFVYFSFFLIIAAAILTGMLFVFSLEQRNAEAGLLLALGLRPKQVRRLFLSEGAVLALVGSVVGAFAGVLYTQVVLWALGSVWRGAVGAVSFQFVLPPDTLTTGIASGIIVALIAMWLASRRQLRHSARELLNGEIVETSKRGRTGRVTFILAAVAFLSAVGMLVSMKGAEAFFGAGSLLLISGLLLALGSLRRLANAATPGLESIGQLGTRNTTRRRGRSLATIAVLASGVFMVVAVDSFRHPPVKDGDTSDPGTGGFALVGESSLPIYEDLNSAKGREAYGLSDDAMRDVRVVQLRVRAGDEASCLNLNRALQPRILGVSPKEFQDRKAFRFEDAKADWTLLSKPLAAGEIPGIADANTLEYSVQKSVGDTIDYTDDRGQPLKIRLVAALSGSILQGNIIISEDEFIKKFPDSGGYRYFLIDCPPDKAEAVRAELSRALTDRGLELTSTARKLGEFQTVENTYLAIFQALGGLGLLLGSAGLAVVVARNVLERRREFGLLAAVGFRPRQLRQLVFVEHRWLIVSALLIGAISALVAVWPNLLQKAGGFPLREMAILILALALGCVFWTWLATRIALRDSGTEALRAE